MYILLHACTRNSFNGLPLMLRICLVLAPAVNFLHACQQGYPCWLCLFLKGRTCVKCMYSRQTASMAQQSLALLARVANLTSPKWLLRSLSADELRCIFLTRCHFHTRTALKDAIFLLPATQQYGHHRSRWDVHVKVKKCEST